MPTVPLQPDLSVTTADDDVAGFTITETLGARVGEKELRIMFR